METKGLPRGILLSTALILLYSFFLLRMSGFPKSFLCFFPNFPFICSWRYHLFVVCDVYNMLGCIVGLIYIVAGLNLLWLKNWARRLVILAAVLSILIFVEAGGELSWLQTLHGKQIHFPPQCLKLSTYSILFLFSVFAIIPLTIIFYLTRQKVKALFI
jgi:hypothetical protein